METAYERKGNVALAVNAKRFIAELVGELAD